jgi:hypothetical protein
MTPGAVGLGALGATTDYLGEVYDRAVPSNIRANIRDLINAPIPGSPAPLMKGFTVAD